jgi:DNA-binding transcriptional MerR regulator
MGRRPASQICGDGTWPADQVASRLRIPVRRVRHLARTALADERGSGKFRCFTATEILTVAVADRLAASGVRLARIRAACHHLREKLRVAEGPLSRFTFFTDGRSVLIDTSNPEAMMDVSEGGQLVFAIALHDIVRTCRRARFLPAAEPPVDEVVVKVRWKTGGVAASRRQRVCH